jgi:hypothetical protein
MKGLVAPVVAALTVLMGLSAAALWIGESSPTIQCDGTVPVWMLVAQDYDGGGCAEILPSYRAPPDADWTPYCIGLCQRLEPPLPS